MDFVEIKKAVNTVLKTNFPDIDINAGETREGFKRPSFFTQIIPVVSEFETQNYKSNKLIIVTNYFPKKNIELDSLKMMNSLQRAFGMTLKVGSRVLTLKNIKSSIVDEIVQFKFDLDYFENIEKKETTTVMGEILTNIRGDN
ncbi:hypothetical protein EUAN_22330 [Andreesenia angusta]|uniref:Phage protein n=1 Tax=Andreesenia angusta TaxID=39480 RepID=A0A1S1V400_9FIRM|nr:hypothetical protein [Andreesenia angusta]OHW61383.1 hypothetical protein EUAN_22330 [Andreesenia angusta]